MSTIIDDNTTVDSKEFDRLVASTVRAMRQSLGVTAAELAKASGVPRPSIEAIERGGASTRGERYDIAVAVEWLLNNAVAKSLPRYQETAPETTDRRDLSWAIPRHVSPGIQTSKRPPPSLRKQRRLLQNPLGACHQVKRLI